MRVAVVVAVAACSSPGAGPDASAPPFHYTLNVGFDTTRPDMPHVFIDGVETMTVDQVYPALTDPITHTIELRYADQVLVHAPAGADPAGGCGGAAQPNVRWTSAVQNLQAYVSGDIRYTDDQWTGENPTDGTHILCTGDGFNIPDCYCQSTERCAPRVTRTQPLFTRMRCTPIGPKALGDPCAMTDDPDGAYDDCGANLVCVGGTCASCSPDVGYPPEARCP